MDDLIAQEVLFPGRTPARRLGGLLAFGGLTAGAAALGAAATGNPRRSAWYLTRRKPPFQPPPAAFGPVWTVLYGLIAASGYRVWRAARGPARRRALRLWGTQLGLNAAWSWLFFRARRPGLALAELGALKAANLAYARQARQVDRTAAWLVAPYLTWVAFAGLLNEEIWRRNR